MNANAKFFEFMASTIAKISTPKFREEAEALHRRIRTDAQADLARAAFDFGQRVAMGWTDQRFGNDIRTGHATRTGGRKGAQITNGPPEKLAAKIEGARTRYAHERMRLPDVGRTELCRIVGEQIGWSAKTVAKYVPNPTPTRRGRPKK